MPFTFVEPIREAILWLNHRPIYCSDHPKDVTINDAATADKVYDGSADAVLQGALAVVCFSPIIGQLDFGSFFRQPIPNRK